MWLSGISDHGSGDLVSKGGSTIKSSWVCTVTSQNSSWYEPRCLLLLFYAIRYELRCCQDTKLQQPTYLPIISKFNDLGQSQPTRLALKHLFLWSHPGNKIGVITKIQSIYAQRVSNPLWFKLCSFNQWMQPNETTPSFVQVNAHDSYFDEQGVLTYHHFWLVVADAGSHFRYVERYAGNITNISILKLDNATRVSSGYLLGVERRLHVQEIGNLVPGRVKPMTYKIGTYRFLA